MSCPGKGSKRLIGRIINITLLAVLVLFVACEDETGCGCETNLSECEEWAATARIPPWGDSCP